MGLALSPDANRAFVGVYTRSGSFLEVFHTRNGFERSIPVGERPSMSWSILGQHGLHHRPRLLHTHRHRHPNLGTAHDRGRTARSRALRQATTVQLPAAALMPFQGRVLLALDLATGTTRDPLTAGTHQHGIAVSPDGKSVAVVGRGLQEAGGQPSLTILTLADGTERIIPLTRPHEMVAFSLDGSEAYLTGGYLLEGAWEGVTVVDLESGATRGSPHPPSQLAFTCWDRVRRLSRQTSIRTAGTATIAARNTPRFLGLAVAQCDPADRSGIRAVEPHQHHGRNRRHREHLGQHHREGASPPRMSAPASVSMKVVMFAPITYGMMWSRQVALERERHKHGQRNTHAECQAGDDAAMRNISGRLLSA
jgi:hypothetical protein